MGTRASAELPFSGSPNDRGEHNYSVAVNADQSPKLLVDFDYCFPAYVSFSIRPTERVSEDEWETQFSLSIVQVADLARFLQFVVDGARAAAAKK